MNIRTWPHRLWLVVGLLAGAVALPGCELLEMGPNGGGDELPVDPPEVALQQVRLVEAPTEMELASYYCHDQLGGLTAELICRTGLKLGAPPIVDPNHPDAIRFSFNMVFEITNPNSFPIPVLEMLLALGVFADEVERNVGGLCVTFCDPGDTECELQSASGCSTEDFPEGGTAGLQIDPAALLEGLLALITGEDTDEWFGNELIRTIEAGGTTNMVVGFHMGVIPMLQVLEATVFTEQNWERLSQGNMPNVEIPYSIEGILWFDVGRIGRVWVRFGPFEDRWDLAEDL